VPAALRLEERAIKRASIWRGPADSTISHASRLAALLRLERYAQNYVASAGWSMGPGMSSSAGGTSTPTTAILRFSAR
jgi:hypothetical protein